MDPLKQRNLSIDGTTEIEIPDILSENTKSSDLEQETEFAFRLNDNTNADDCESNGHIYAKVVDERNSFSTGQRKRRSGVVNSMDGLNQIPATEYHDNSNDLPASESVCPSDLQSSSSDSSSISESSDAEMSTVVLDQNEEKGEMEETDDKISEIRNNNNNSFNYKYSFENHPDTIYDETKPRRSLSLDRSNGLNNSEKVQYDETKPKRKVSFDTVMPQIRKLRNESKAENMPIRKISLDAGLDARNVRKVSFDAGVGSRMNNGIANNESSNIRKISFDALSGTLHIRRISYDIESDKAPSVDFEIESDTNSVQLRRASYEADSEPDLGHINRGFDNDTYLDNVTFHVQRVTEDEKENELNDGYCSPEKQNGKPNLTVDLSETKSILKGAKKPSFETLPTKNDANGKSSNEENSTSSLASHVRKDSIALTSEKLGQILNIQKHYSQMHNKQRPFWKQRELLKKYQLHLGVAGLFVLTLILVSLGWYFHDRARKEKTISQRIFFEASSRHLKLSDPENLDRFKGNLGVHVPHWPKPTHCLNEKESQEFQCLNWRGNARLRISYFSKTELNCYNISWESLRHELYPTDCFDIGPAIWYGPVNMSNPVWPIQEANFTFSAAYSQTFKGSFESAIENYWLSSAGVGILVQDNIPLVLNWNRTSPNQFCITSNYTGDFYGHKTHFAKHFLNYTVCNGNDALVTQKYFRSRLPAAPSDFPAKKLYSNPLWSSIQGQENDEITEENVLQTSDKLQKLNLSCSSIVLDGAWEKEQGDFEFDAQRFSNISTLVSKVMASSGCSLMVSISPYFDYLSDSFSDGHPKDHFILDASGRVPALMRWKDKIVAMLDVTNPAARSWMTGKMMDISSQYKIDSFRLVYDQPQWLPFHPTFDDYDVTPSQVRKLFTEMVSSFSKSDTDVIEGTSETQDLRIFISVPTKVEITEEGLCLLGAIPNALTLGLLGYPFIMADGIVFKGTIDYIEDEPEKLPRQLLLRWIQMAAFFPAMKYSIYPWEYDSDTIAVAKNASDIHRTYVVELMEEIKEEITNGDPIIRPIWWIDPSDEEAHIATDQFLVGDDILVAPVLCEGVTSRRIYFPMGLWSDPQTGSLVIGKQWYEYPVSLYKIPFFIRKDYLGKAKLFRGEP